MDPTEWTCKSYTVSTRVLTSKDADGNPTSRTIVSLRAPLVRNEESRAAKTLIEGMLAKAKKKAPRPIKRIKSPGSGLMAEFGPYDAHFGLQSWGRQTLGPNYDLEIATREWSDALDTLLGRLSGYGRLDKVSFVIGNDMVHYDNLEAKTTAGTPQDADTRYHRLVEHLNAMLRDQVARIAKDVAPVDVIPVEGNHDRLSTWHIGNVLDAYFDRSKHVTVDTEPSPRKYVRHGKCLIMLNHGDVAGGNSGILRLPLEMAQERRKDWGETIHSEVHVGHLHNESVRDVQGVIVRRMLAMTPACNWSSHQGYGHPTRGIEGFLWHAEDGLVNQPRVVLPRAA